MLIKINRFNKKIALFFLIFVLISVNLTYGAIIKGQVYNSTLDEINDVIVIINSNPIQRYIVKDGTYFFELPPGRYKLIARTFADEENVLGTDVDLIITKEGSFVVDLILEEMTKEQLKEEIPKPYEEETNNNETNIFNNIKANTIITSSLILIGIILLLAILIYLIKNKSNLKNKKKDTTQSINFELISDNNNRDNDEIYEIKDTTKKEDIKDETKIDINSNDEYLNKVLNLIKKEKRITQKEIRKNFDLSEAKISLIISELEEKKIIKKIKKGRGNIIIFNKN